MSTDITKKFLKSKRRENKKKAYSFRLSRSAEADLLRLCEQNDDVSMSNVVAEALHFAYVNGMYGADRYRIVRETASPTVLPTKGIKEKRQESKEAWCVEFGGKVENGQCKYTKYETTAMGEVVKNTRTQLIDVMPEDKDGFARHILGSFATISEAEFAYQEQAKKKSDDKK